MANRVLDNINLVYHIANKYGSYCNNREDLYQAGTVGLVCADLNYDESKGVNFSSYAGKYIMGEILKTLREERSVKLSKDVMKLNQSFLKAKDMLTQRLGREASDTEVCLFLDVDIDKVNEARCLCQYIESLDSSLDPDSDYNYYNSIKFNDNNLDIDHIALMSVIESLDDDEKQLIYSRYFDGFTQCELSSELGISQVQVSRKESKILEKMRVRL